MSATDGLHGAISRRVSEYQQLPDLQYQRVARDLMEDLHSHPASDVTYHSHVYLSRKVMAYHAPSIKGRRITCACGEFSISAATSALRKQAHQAHVAERLVSILGA